MCYEGQAEDTSVRQALPKMRCQCWSARRRRNTYFSHFLIENETGLVGEDIEDGVHC